MICLLINNKKSRKLKTLLMQYDNLCIKKKSGRETTIGTVLVSYPNILKIILKNIYITIKLLICTFILKIEKSMEGYLMFN